MIVDSRTGSLIATVDRGLGAYNVDMDGHLHIGVVGNEKSAALIDMRSGAVSLTPLESVFDVKVDAQSDRAFLTTGLKDQRLTVLDVRTGVVERAISVGPIPTYIGIDSRSDRAYVIDNPSGFNGPSTVAVVELHAARMLGQIPVGSYPDAIAVDARRGRVFVANALGISVTVIDGNRP